MHRIDIPQDVIDYVVQRRGDRLVNSDIDPRRTAMIGVDLQNGFMKEGIAHVVTRTAIGIVPNVNRIARYLRAAGGMVCWTRHTIDDDSLQTWSHFHYQLNLPQFRDRRIKALREGSPGHALWSDLEVAPEDVVVNKNRWSAFIQGSSPLESMLRKNGVDTLLITGTWTDVCCESTARDAVMLNFKTIMITDANATISDRAHNASLAAFYLTFGDIMSTDEVISYIDRNACFSANNSDKLL
jgi:ureidoacrylate peracid hydrolase